MKQLFFVRHGESELNVQRIFAGSIDTPLTTLGEQQAELAGIHAKPLGIGLIVSSPLVRAYKTAEIIAEMIGYPIEKIVKSDLLREHFMGSLEGKSWDDYDEEDSPFPDAETEGQLLLRAQQALEYLQSLEADNVLVVSHGSFGLALRAAINSNEQYPEPENAEIIQLI
jgi:broad specificity phosphatase PhoE